MTSIVLKGFTIKDGKVARDVRRLSVSARQQRQASSRVRVSRGRAAISFEAPTPAAEPRRRPTPGAKPSRSRGGVAGDFGTSTRRRVRAHHGVTQPAAINASQAGSVQLYRIEIEPVSMTRGGSQRYRVRHDGKVLIKSTPRPELEACAILLASGCVGCLSVTHTDAPYMACMHMDIAAGAALARELGRVP